MNNEIGRKITSLTLMTIMLAGGMTFAAPSMMPAAFAANANLFVSAENSQFDNYMSGPQVIEVVVIDSDINDTDQAKGEPDVTVNGKILRMAQAVDGNWYGYFADRTQAIAADGTVGATEGLGLDFGAICTAAQAEINIGPSFADTVGVAMQRLNANCGVTAPDADILNVVREAKLLNSNAAANAGGPTVGQIGVDVLGEWPFIQLYSLSVGGNVVVQYNKGGGAQSTTLTFDTVDQFASASLDRAVYPQGAQVHATIIDLWLNIDPTDEDSWTFGTVGAISTNYQVFDENGLSVGNATSNTDTNTLTATLGTLMCEDNCVLALNTDAQGKGDVITIQDNDDSNIVVSSATPDVQNPTAFGVPFGVFPSNAAPLLNATVPVTITEQGPNSGVFGTYDEADTSVIKITDDANRGTSASIDYNETPVTVLVGFGFASVDMQPSDDEWNSGEEIPVVIVDSDANKNSRADEDLDLFDAAVTLIPSLRTGDPFTLAEDNNNDDAPLEGVFIANVTNIVPATKTSGALLPLSGATNVTADIAVEKFSKRGIAEVNATNAAVEGFLIDLAATAEELKGSINDKATGTFFGFNMFNVDLRSITTTGSVDVYVVNGPAGTVIVDDDANVADGLTITSLLNGTSVQSLSRLTSAASDTAAVITARDAVENRIFGLTDSDRIGLLFIFSDPVSTDIIEKEAFVADFFSFGFENDGLEANERIANQLIKIEAEESGDNTSSFEGSLEYIMVNQLNILDPSTYEDLSTIADDPSFIVIEDLTDEDSPRVNYLDLGADGVSTQVADQEEAPSHSGVVSFDQSSYKNADTVTITLEDLDLNVDSDLIDIYTVVTIVGDDNRDAVGSATVANGGTSIELSNGDQLGRLLDVTFDDQPWTENNSCGLDASIDAGLGDTGFTLIETGTETGVFVGDFQIPGAWCREDATAPESVTGLDIEVNYVDFRDASGEVIEVGDSAGVRANTGSVSLDRTVYPVPFGTPDRYNTNSNTTPTERSLFPIHQSGMNGNAGLQPGEFLAKGGLTVHVRVSDPDFDISASGEDAINSNTATKATGPVKLSVIRGASTTVLGYAGGPTTISGVIDVGNTAKNMHYLGTDNAIGGVGSAADSIVFAVDLGTSNTSVTVDNVTLPQYDAGIDFILNNADDVDAIVRQFGPIDEIAPDAGIFESDILIRYTDGPASTTCPVTDNFIPLDGTSGLGGETTRFTKLAAAGAYCILQGDILQVEYTDPADASGDVNTVTDSATFDLRNGVLQSDKSVYIIGSDMILTLIEPDLDLDNDQAETYDLDLIEWDSDAATLTMGDAGGDAGAFDPEPLNFRETGDSTGIFQIIVEIPQELDGDNLERGEEIVLEYTDWGPSGADFVGNEDEDVNLTIFTSNFGATVELDQKVYTWTDKVYITIVAPDHNFDSDLVDEIGNTDLDPIKVATRGADLDKYKLVETGTDTGIFTGEVILTGFTHDADGDSTTGTDGNDVVTTSSTGSGPTDGLLSADDDDGLTVSFEFSEDETVVGSALIRWNIGEVQWLEASYPASGTGVVRVIDPDMNLDPEAVDNFDVDVWSDSDAGGIDLTVTETNEATGIYEGTVFFTTTDESSGHRLRVAEGDTVTAEYEDNTLPDPYTTADELDITATSLIGTVVPPLERAPAANLRTVDAFGNSLDTVSVDQQVQISADLANGQDREQAFAYLVQIQDGNGVTVSLAWITGSLSSGQSFSPALSWIPTQSGSYTATAFVWESVDNPTALSPPVSTTITVQ